MRNYVVLAFALVVAGCGDNAIVMDMSQPDLSMPDLTPPKDFAMPDFAGVACGSMTCGAGDSCCAMVTGNGSVNGTCMPNGTCQADGGTAALMCDGPEDCSGKGCCATFDFQAQMGPDGGTPTGGSGTGDSACSTQNQCIASVTYNQSTGTGIVHTQLCHTMTDCMNLSGMIAFGSFVTNMPFTSCCTRNGIGYSFCAPPPSQFTMGLYTCQ